MTASFGPPQEVFIGAFAFDAERRQLIGEGGAVELALKEFELLSLLVEKRPRAVSKDEIRDALWPRTIVAETSLTTLVKELRTKLRQEGREGPIRTVHGRPTSRAPSRRSERWAGRWGWFRSGRGR